MLEVMDRARVTVMVRVWVRVRAHVPIGARAWGRSACTHRTIATKVSIKYNIVWVWVS